MGGCAGAARRCHSLQWLHLQGHRDPGFLRPLCQLLPRRVKGGDCVIEGSAGPTASSRSWTELALPPAHILWEGPASAAFL